MSRQLGLNSGDITDSLLGELIGRETSPLVFDVGANIGEFSAQCIKINKKTKIYAFEPQIEMIETIRNKLPKNALIFPIALSEKTGKMQMVRKFEGDRKAHASQIDEQVSFVIEKSTIDIMVENLAIQEIDLLKIDTEGHDFEVLKGAEQSLASNKIKCIVFEIMPRLLLQGHTPEDVETLLRRHNFTKFFRMTPHLGLLPLQSLDNSEFRTQNIVCIK